MINSMPVVWPPYVPMDIAQMLYYAAKAVGFTDDKTGDIEAPGLHRNEQGHFYFVDKNGLHLWDPSEDDGDSRRLEVALRLEIQHDFNGEEDRVQVLTGYTEDDKWTVELYGDDACAATRLAVLRVAADVGKAKV